MLAELQKDSGVVLGSGLVRLEDADPWTGAESPQSFQIFRLAVSCGKAGAQFPPPRTTSGRKIRSARRTISTRLGSPRRKSLVWLLGSRLLDQLEASAQIPLGSDATDRLRQWYRRDHDDAWAQLATSRVQHSALDLGPAADELALPS